MRNTYKIVDVMKILDMGRDQLFYWFKTKKLIKPEIEGKGRGARTKFSKTNIFELAIVKELSKLGIELNFIYEILSSKKLFGEKIISMNNVTNFLVKRYQNLEDKDKQNEDLFLFIYKNEQNKYLLHPIFKNSEGADSIVDKRLGSAHLVINIYEIFRKIERRIGEET